MRPLHSGQQLHFTKRGTSRSGRWAPMPHPGPLPLKPRLSMPHLGGFGQSQFSLPHMHGAPALQAQAGFAAHSHFSPQRHGAPALQVQGGFGQSQFSLPQMHGAPALQAQAGVGASWANANVASAIENAIVIFFILSSFLFFMLNLGRRRNAPLPQTAAYCTIFPQTPPL